MTKFIFECIDCKKEYLPADVEYLCPQCSRGQKQMEPLSGVLRCVYDYKNIAKKGLINSSSRWSEILPIENINSIPPLAIGNTPLRTVSNLRRVLGLHSLWIKDDTVQPTASFKDRASALVVACAKEKDRDTVATASTGNAATALAGMAASSGIKSVIFVPESAPPAKLTQIAVYGGKLIPIKGTYDEAFELSIKACNEFGWYNRNTAYNPFTIEGKKTAALEIWEQLGCVAPDWVIVPTGDGAILAGMEKGFSDLKEIGFVGRLPKLVAVQAFGASPIVKAFENGSKKIVSEKNPRTIADSISVGVPRAGSWVMQALERTKGIAVAVSDEEILDSISFLGSYEGVFAEPAAATSIAGLRKLVSKGVVGCDEKTVVLITGNGLKDIPSASKSIEIPKAIEPSISSVKKLFNHK